MGWASGSTLMGDVIRALMEHVPSRTMRQNAYEDIIEAFTDADCDTLDEVVGLDPAFDTAYKFKFPEEQDE